MEWLSQVRNWAYACAYICTCHSVLGQFQRCTGALQRSFHPVAGSPSHNRRDCLYQLGHWLLRQADLLAPGERHSLFPPCQDTGQGCRLPGDHLSKVSGAVFREQVRGQPGWVPLFKPRGPAPGHTSAVWRELVLPLMLLNQPSPTALKDTAHLPHPG